MTMSGIGRSCTATLAAVALLLALVGCTPTSTPTPSQVPNPDLVRRCGIDVNLVVDRSNSVAGSVGAATAAAQAMVDGLAGTGARVRLASFGSFGSGHPGGQNAASFALGALTWSAVDGYVVPPLTQVSGPFGPLFPDQGSTNMEAGLEFIRRAPGPVGDLTVVFSDGEPNEHNLSTPNGLPGPNVNLGKARSEAIAEANRLKQAGTHVLAVGVSGWHGVSTATLQAISGPDRLGGVPVEEADYVDLASFDAAVPALRDVASQLCRSTLSIRKFLRWQDERLPLCDIDFRVAADPAPTEWSTGGDGDQFLRTCRANDRNAPRPLGGLTSISWTPSAPSHTLTVDEVPPELFLFESVVCTKADRVNGGRVQVPVTVTSADGTFDVQVGAQDEVQCDVDNQLRLDGASADRLIVLTRTTDPADGLTLLNAQVSGNPTTTIAAPGAGAFLVGTTPTLRFTPLESGWYLQSLECDGAAQPAPAFATPTFAPGSTHVCVLTVGRTPTLGTVDLVATYNAETGPALPATWSLTFPGGTSSTQALGVVANARPRPNLPPAMSWGVDPGAPFTLTPVSSDPSLVLESFSCRTPAGNTVGDVTGATFPVAVNTTVRCTAGYTRLQPVSISLHAVVLDDPDPAPGPPVPLPDLTWSSGPVGTTPAIRSGDIATAALTWTGLPATYRLTDLTDLTNLTFVEATCQILGPNGGGVVSALSGQLDVALQSGQLADCTATYQRTSQP